MKEGRIHIYKDKKGRWRYRLSLKLCGKWVIGAVSPKGYDTFAIADELAHIVLVDTWHIEGENPPVPKRSFFRRLFFPLLTLLLLNTSLSTGCLSRPTLTGIYRQPENAEEGPVYQYTDRVTETVEPYAKIILPLLLAAVALQAGYAFYRRRGATKTAGSSGKDKGRNGDDKRRA